MLFGEMPVSSVYLGHCDPGCVPTEPKALLDRFHNVPGSAALKGRLSFRDDDRSTWRRFKEAKASATSVADIHNFLHESGFMPRTRERPVFDYVTQASVRLFQEYLRTVDDIKSMKADGIVGQQTVRQMQIWQADNRKSRWGNTTPGSEYATWMKTLKLAKSRYTQSPAAALKATGQFPDKTDTRKLSDWTFESTDIHLIGLRQHEQLSTDKRQSDDIFILLINGMVFKFWGSADPSAHMSNRDDEAYLVEGQHKYRFSWHKVSDSNKVYRALRPYRHGVLVFRDRDSNNALTHEDVLAGIDPDTNHTINIHWSGIGSSNWSAGCQVIAGKSYINDVGQIIDCSGFAATNYSELNNTHRKTKGAYNMLADLVLCYAPESVDYLLYSLGRDESFNLSDTFEPGYVGETFASMQI